MSDFNAHSDCWTFKYQSRIPYSKVHGANIGPIWGRQDPGVPYVGPMNLAMFMGPTWGPSGADRTQVGPMLALWTLLSGIYCMYEGVRPSADTVLTTILAVNHQWSKVLTHYGLVLHPEKIFFVEKPWARLICRPEVNHVQLHADVADSRGPYRTI